MSRNKHTLVALLIIRYIIDRIYAISGKAILDNDHN